MLPDSIQFRGHRHTQKKLFHTISGRTAILRTKRCQLPKASSAVIRKGNWERSKNVGLQECMEIEYGNGAVNEVVKTFLEMTLYSQVIFQLSRDWKYSLSWKSTGMQETESWITDKTIKNALLNTGKVSQGKLNTHVKIPQNWSNGTGTIGHYTKIREELGTALESALIFFFPFPFTYINREG